MTKMKPFIKAKAFKKNKSNKSVWALLCASILVITIFVFRSYAEYVVTKEEIAISNSSVGKFYTEALLNGADPVLTNNLVPVTIGNDGTVYEASTVGGTSEITTEYEDFFTNSNWNKYYDLYTSTLNTEFNNRILGDATGEMGPFANLMSSWNNDKVAFIKSSNPWMQRGASAKDGYWTGLYAFNPHFGEGNTFRIVLAPK